jgi:hypothetical protein
MDRLIRWKARRQRAVAARTTECLREWERASRSILRLCQAAIDDEHAGTGDIGTNLDKLDRELHRLKDTAAAVSGVLRRQEPDLARTAAEITDDLYRLRNQTASYLIRAQGPTPPFLENGSSGDALRDDRRRVAYQQVGADARRLAGELDQRLKVFERLSPPRETPVSTPAPTGE